VLLLDELLEQTRGDRIAAAALIAGGQDHEIPEVSDVRARFAEYLASGPLEETGLAADPVMRERMVLLGLRK
jgi:hypothetical protein